MILILQISIPQLKSLEQRVGQIESNTGSYDDQTVITSLNSYTNGNDSNDTTNTTQKNTRLDQLKLVLYQQNRTQDTRFIFNINWFSRL